MIARNHCVGTLVEVFNSDEAARAAVEELKAVGFKDTQIVMSSHPSIAVLNDAESEEVAQAATKGAAAGFGLGALWGMCVVMGIAPDWVQIVGGGAWGVVLSSAVAGAAILGTVGAFFGTGARRVESVDQPTDQLSSCAGHTIVTVKAGARADIASSILNRFNHPGCVSLTMS